jgi:hypothetical protein
MPWVIIANKFISPYFISKTNNENKFIKDYFIFKNY